MHTIYLHSDLKQRTSHISAPIATHDSESLGRLGGPEIDPSIYIHIRLSAILEPKLESENCSPGELLAAKGPFQPFIFYSAMEEDAQ